MSMTGSTFSRHEFKAEEPKGALAVCAWGLGSLISDLRPMVGELATAGYDAICYKYSPSVLTSGDPQALPGLVEGMKDDAEPITANYDRLLFVGASMGALLMFNLQQANRRPAHGIYACAGVPLAHVVATHEDFVAVRKRFAQNGYKPEELEKVLNKAWQAVDVSPKREPDQGKPITVIWAENDRTVKPAEAAHTIQNWQQRFHFWAKVIYKKGLDHQGGMEWARDHITELLPEAA